MDVEPPEDWTDHLQDRVIGLLMVALVALVGIGALVLLGVLIYVAARALLGLI